MTVENAINHTRLGWALAQTYTAKGLGVDAGKLKTLRESLAFDTHYTVESGANGTRIYYTKLGVLALAKLIGTPKAAEFAAECVRSASGALVPVAAAPVQEVGWNPVGQLQNREVYDYIPQSMREPEPEYLDAYPVQGALTTQSGSPVIHYPATNSKVSYTVNYAVSHHHHAQSRPVPAFQAFSNPNIFWATFCLMLACLLMPIALIGMAYRPTPQTTIYMGR